MNIPSQRVYFWAAVRHTVCVICSFGTFFVLESEVAGAQEVYLAQGQFAGEVTESTALLQTRLTAISGPELDSNGDVPGAAGLVRFEYRVAESATREQEGNAWKTTDWMPAVGSRDYIVRVWIDALESGTKYQYRAIGLSNAADGESQATTSSVCSFKTLAGAESSETVTFCMGSCMHYHAFMSGKSNGGGPVTATPEDRRLGYRVFEAMLSESPDFFIGTGDIVYYDHPRESPARTRDELQKKWHEQFRFPRLKEFFGSTAAYWSKDDHDFRFDDADLAGTRLPAADLGIDMFRLQLPLVPAGDGRTPTYRTHRVHEHLQLWFVEGRDYRSPNRMEDGPEKSIWGPEQTAWLQRTLRESDATWKVIISPTPMVGPDRASKRDNHTNPKGFRYEGEAFMKWLQAEGITNVMTFCGDRHWQFHSVHPFGLEEFGCGALNDENAIRGIGPGAKGSTDPEGLIDQRYRYPKPSGGYLKAQVSATAEIATLAIELKDDEGTVGYRVEKQAAID